MRTELSPTLARILTDTRQEIARDKERHSPKRMKQMVGDAPPTRSFHDALAPGKALIAEIKERSPSQGPMRDENVREAARAYKESGIVKGISVLTSHTNFGAGMTLERLRMVREETGKPVLRKDFIIEEYQVYQARAYGADAILLMANILDRETMLRLSGLAQALGMDVLFETHRVSELADLPEGARIVGVNSRNFEGGAGKFALARMLRRLGWKRDQSTNTERFSLITELPAKAIKVAESGVSSSNCSEVFALGFHALLVGTSLLLDARGIRAALKDFEIAIAGLKARPKSAVSALERAPA